jgi:PPOX class probable F420-dependent enzyme
MVAALPDSVRKLIEAPNFVHVATLMPDGSPQVSPVWVDFDGKNVLFNTAEGRAKPRNLRRDARVALSIVSQDNPYATASIRGKVVEISTDGADEHIDKLAMKYMGQETYPYRQPDEQRLIVRIEPEHITTYGLD